MPKDIFLTNLQHFELSQFRPLLRREIIILRLYLSTDENIRLSLV